MKVTNYTNECLYKDTYTIITMMDGDLRSKISNKFIEFLMVNMDKEFEGTINNKVPLKNQELRYEVRLMLSLIYINFICDDETQKKLEAIDEENIQKFYNRDIFDNASSSSEVIDSEAEESNEENSLVEYKETFLKKIWNKIKSIFNKNK